MIEYLHNQALVCLLYQRLTLIKSGKSYKLESSVSDMFSISMRLIESVLAMSDSTEPNTIMEQV